MLEDSPRPVNSDYHFFPVTPARLTGQNSRKPDKLPGAPCYREGTKKSYSFRDAT
jgi:hypothetical protein